MVCIAGHERAAEAQAHTPPKLVISSTAPPVTTLVTCKQLWTGAATPQTITHTFQGNTLVCEVTVDSLADAIAIKEQALGSTATSIECGVAASSPPTSTTMTAFLDVSASAVPATWPTPSAGSFGIDY